MTSFIMWTLAITNYYLLPINNSLFIPYGNKKKQTALYLLMHNKPKVNFDCNVIHVNFVFMNYII